MAKKQTRRSISVNRQLYIDATAFALAEGIALSQLCDQALRLRMGLPPSSAVPIKVGDVVKLATVAGAGAQAMTVDRMPNPDLAICKWFERRPDGTYATELKRGEFNPRDLVPAAAAVQPAAAS